VVYLGVDLALRYDADWVVQPVYRRQRSRGDHDAGALVDAAP
jgi:hypothetical protein